MGGSEVKKVMLKVYKSGGRAQGLAQAPGKEGESL